MATSRSKVWRHMEQISPSTVVCRLCDRKMIFNSASTSSLLRHLLRLHFGGNHAAMEAGIVNSKDGKYTQADSIYDRRRSVVWQFVEKINDKETTCKLCGRKFLSSTHSNLLRHIKMKHFKDNPEDLKTLQEELDKEEEAPVAPPPILNITATSKIWSYMEKNGQNHVKCRLCGSLLLHRSGSTASIWKHLKNQHFSDNPEALEPGHSVVEFCEPKEQVAKSEEITKPLSTSSKVVKWSKAPTAKSSTSETISRFKYSANFKDEPDRKEQLNRQVLTMIVDGLHPFSMVEEEGFLQLVRSLDPKFTMPSQVFLHDILLPQAYVEIKASVASQLHSAASISVSAEIWTHYSGHVILTAFAHFISDIWEHHTVMLGSEQLPDSYNGQTITNQLYKMFELWKISSKVFCVTTDTSQDMVEAVAQLSINHQVCYALNFKMVVESAIRDVQGVEFLREKVKDIVNFLKTNSDALQALTSSQVKQGKSPLELKGEVEGSWMSVYYMFQRYIELHSYVTESLNGVDKQEMTIGTEDYNAIEECLKALQPFHLLTKELASEDFISLSKIIPTTRTLSKYLNNSILTGSLAEELKNKLNQRFMNLESDMFCAAAAYLDPRFKDLAFDNLDTSTNVQNELKSMIELQLSNKPDKVENTPMEELQEATMSIWSDFDQQVQGKTPESSRVKTVSDSEFTKYDSENFIRRTDNPLKWWRSKERFFPALAKLAKQFLGVAATSLSPGLIFTRGGEEKCMRRHFFDKSTLDPVLFLNGNKNLLSS